MSVRPVGIAVRDIPGSPATPAEVIDALLHLDIRLVHVPSVTHLVPDLDPAKLTAVRSLLHSTGCRLATGLGSLGSQDPGRAAAATAAGDGDVMLGWRRLIEASQRVGATSVHFTVGTIEDRFDRTVPWSRRLTETTTRLRMLAPVARDAGLPLVLKTHEEMTTLEVVEMVQAVGPDMLSVGFSPVNVLVRLEDPVIAATRIAPYVHTFFLDDAAVSWSRRGLARHMTPLGLGDVPWVEILSTLDPEQTCPLVLDLHRAELDMPMYDDGWVADRPDLTVDELLRVASIARRETPPTASLAERGHAAMQALFELASPRTPVSV